MGIDLRMLGRADYPATVQAMQDYTAARTPESADLLLICEHSALTYKKYNGIYAAKQQSAEHNIFHGVPLFSESCSIIAQSGS